VKRGSGDPSKSSNMSGSVEGAMTVPIGAGANVATKALGAALPVVLGGRHTMAGKTSIQTL